MSLLAETFEALARHELRFAIVGATAMAAHGVARSTMDIDILLVGRSVLDSPVWKDLERRGAAVEIRRGTADDPLEGVVRLRRKPDSPIDIIVGSASWQRRAIERARPSELLGVVGPVASALDLVLLKLHAGSPQDCWDVQRLLSASRDVDLPPAVDAEIGALPVEARELWRSIRNGL